MSVTVNRTAQRYSSGAQATPRMVLLHTTEGMGWPGYGGGSSAPHATIRPIPGEGIEVREHIPFTQFAKALQNRAGGVQTNTSGVLQFELMGTCDERSAGSMYYWPRADDAVLRALADYLRPIMATYGIPHASDVTWKSYNRGQHPSSYGLSNGVRMSYAKWGAFRGICGHQHAPENDHGDPGDFPIATLLRYLGGTALPALDEQEWTPTGDWSTKDIQTLVGVTADGVYGTGTTRAVAALQASLDLTADGLWGKTTEGAVMTILTDIQADLKAIKTTQNEHTAAIADVEDWTRKAVNGSLWAGPSRTIAALSAVLADTQGVDVDKLATAIADAIRDDVAKAGSGATAEQIADVLAKRLAS